MTKLEVIRESCLDELVKIAGASRFGRVPISPANLASKTTNLWKSGSKSTRVKTSSPSVESVKKNLPVIGAAVGGASLYHVARKANEDRRMGRAMRLQSQQ